MQLRRMIGAIYRKRVAGTSRLPGNRVEVFNQAEFVREGKLLEWSEFRVKFFDWRVPY